MVGITELSALMSSLKGAKDLAESMIGLREAAALQSKIMDFNIAIIDAQQRVFSAQEERSALIEKVADLEKKITSLERWETEKQRYELKGAGFDNGAMVYQLKTEEAGTELPHSICAHCYENSVKSILQSDRAGSDTYLMCPRCKTSLLIGGHGHRRR